MGDILLQGKNIISFKTCDIVSQMDPHGYTRGRLGRLKNSLINGLVVPVHCLDGAISHQTTRHSQPF